VTPVAPNPLAVAAGEVDNRVGSETSGREQRHPLLPRGAAVASHEGRRYRIAAVTS